MASKTHQIAMEIGAKIKSTFSSSFMDATSKVSALQQKMKEFEIAGAKATALDSSFVKMKQRTQDMQFQWAAASVKAKQLGEAIKSTESPTKAQSREFEKAQTKAHNLQLKLEKLREQQKDIELSSRKQAESVKNLSAEYAKAGVNVAKFGKIQEQQAKIAALHQKAANHAINANNYAMIARTTVGMSNFLAEPIKQAMHFETVMSEVRKLVHFDTPQQFKEMSSQLKDMSARVPVTVEGLGHIMAAAAQAGIHRPDLLAFTEDAAHMATAWGISAEQSGDMLAKWRSAFQLTQPEVIKLADQVHLLSDNTAATGSEIGDVVTRIGALGKIAGVSTQEVAALAATSIGAGVKAEIAATGIKKMMLTLSSGTTATKSQATAFTSLGINVVQLGKDLQKGGVTPMLEVLKKIKRLAPEKQAPMLKQIFGEESIAPIAGIMNNLDQVKHNLTLVGDESKYSGLMIKEFGIRSKTTENAIQLLKNQTAGVAITIGEMLLPTINNAVKAISNIVNTIRPWVESHSTLVKWGLAVAGALAGVTIAVSSLAFLFSGTLAIALKTAAAAMWVFNSAVLANPITWIVAGVVALGVAIAAVIIYWKDITQAVSSFGNSIMDLMAKLNPLYKLGEKLGQAFDWMTGAGDKNINVNYKVEKNNLDESIKQLQQSNAARSKPAAVNYSPNYTVNVSGGGDVKDIERALVKASGQERNNFTAWNDSSRLAY